MSEVRTTYEMTLRRGDPKTQADFDELWKAAREGGAISVNGALMRVEIGKIEADIINGGPEEVTFLLLLPQPTYSWPDISRQRPL